jgi:hypothetical protein
VRSNPLGTIAIEPRAITHHDLARAYAGSGRPADAVREMERAIDLDPGVTYYHRWLVNHYVETGDVERGGLWLTRMEASLSADEESAEEKRWITQARTLIRTQQAGEPVSPTAAP